MTEEEAKQILNVPRETWERLCSLVELVRRENERQNLVSRGSLERVWERHVLDSAQLLAFAPSAGDWIDLGTGGGFPGMVIAIIRQGPITMVEARRLRAEFLLRAVDALGLHDRVTVVQSRVEALPPRIFQIISARAFAPLDKLLEMGQRFAAPTTRWVLPKGQNAKSELDAASRLWQGNFRIELSRTSRDSGIIVADHVRLTSERRG